MRKSLLFCLTLLLAIGVGFAQEMRLIKGVITSAEDGQPVIGATIIVHGKKNLGTVTGVDGDFKLKVPVTAKEFQVSFIGFSTKAVAIKKAQNFYKVSLLVDTQMLDEVVAVGYSKATKRSFTGSAVTVKAAELSKKSVSSITQALSGEVPGVNIVNTNGQPGSSPDVYVRGIGSIEGSTGPLYVVDGVPYMGGINSINPSDIESTTLLKDAAATSIYGARGSNGVIVITTKKGQSGKFSVNATFKQGYNTSSFIPRHSVITSPEEYMEIGWDGLRNQYIWKTHTAPDPSDPSKKIVLERTKENMAKWDEEGRKFANKKLFGQSGIDPRYNMWEPLAGGESLIDPATGKFRPNVKRRYTPELWADEAFQTSLRTEGNIQLAGGTSKLRAFMSLGYLDDRGVAKNSSFKRLTGRLNLNFNPYKWLTASGSLAYNRSEATTAGQGSASSTNLFTYIDNMPPIYPVYLRKTISEQYVDPADGKTKTRVIGSSAEKVKDPYYPGRYQFDYGHGRGYAGGGSNGLADAFYNPDVNLINNVDFNVNATIKFLDGFSLENTLSGTYRSNDDRERVNPWYGQNAANNGTLYHVNTHSFSYNVLSLLRYAKSFGEHSIEAFLAHEATDYEYKKDWASKKGLVDPFVDAFDNALSSNFSPTGYTDSYALESYFAQANYDYANKYFVSASIRRDGSSKFLNNKWGTFGSGSLAWVASEEDFLKDNKVINYLKLKASYGTLGQQGGIGYYTGFDLFEASPLGGDISLKFREKGSPDLTWERSSMAQLGFEMTFFKKLDLNVELYHKFSSDFLYDRRVAPSNGYAIYKVNDGAMINQGIDIDLTYHILKTRDSYLDFKVNAGFLRNYIDEMPIEPSTSKPKFLDTSLSPYGRQAGKALYEYYMQEYVGVNPENGLSQWTSYYVDLDGDKKFSKGDKVIKSLVEYKHNNPNDVDKILKRVTEDHEEATLDYVGKSALPVVRGAFTLSTGYKGFDFSLQCIYSLGGYGYDYVYAGLMDGGQIGNNNWHTDIRNRWTKRGQVTDVPRLANGLDKKVNGRSTRFLTSNSFLNLANVRLGYTLPKKWTSAVYMSKANIWISGDNLFLLSARKGFNPATSVTGGSSTFTYSPLTTLSAGISLSF